MTVPMDRLATALADRYRLDGLAGEGGMATVYIADDLKHQRRVAVKVLRPELAATLGGERFAREIAIAAKLNHPHILMLIDSGDAEGHLYYVTPYVDGGSLRDRLRASRTVPVHDALRIAQQVAHALAYAHAQGVVHRDVKPENILFWGDQAVLADFGIARAVEAAGGERLTGTGLAVGTPTYMSPEQAFGGGQVDGRSDVYALGCVLFEMLTGHPPFTGPTPQSVLAQHAVDTIPALSAVVPDIPLFVSRAVQKALAKDPDARFADAKLLADTLASETVVAPVGRRRVAVLAPASAAAEDQAHLALGLHEALIAMIGQGDVAVIARASVLPYTGAPKPVRDIARDLSVEAVVESSVLRNGAAVSVQARLVDATSEETLWSGSRDGSMEGLFGLYREVAGMVAEQVHQRYAPGRAIESRERPAVDQATYENYVRGRAHQERFTPNDLETALQYYQAALRANPRFAPAHAGISLVWGSRVVMGLVPPLEGGPRWREAAERAVATDARLADGHQALGQAHAFFEWDWQRAEACFEQAIALNPNDPLARTMFSHFLAAMRRPGSALQQGQRALELDPLNPFHHTMYGLVLMFARRYEDAVEHLTGSLAMMPANVLARLGLAGASCRLGRLSAALSHHADLFGFFGDAELAGVLRAGASDGDPRRAFRRAGELLDQRSRVTFVKPMHAVIMFSWGGDMDRAFAWTERAFESRDHDMTYLAAAPWPDEFHADPRFDAMLNRMKFPAASTVEG